VPKPRWLSISVAALLAVAALLLGLLAIFAVPAYSALMIFWYHVTAAEVLPVTGTVAAVLLLVAMALAKASRVSCRRKG
jgi:hypothetical protein